MVEDLLKLQADAAVSEARLANIASQLASLLQEQHAVLDVERAREVLASASRDRHLIGQILQSFDLGLTKAMRSGPIVLQSRARMQPFFNDLRHRMMIWVQVQEVMQSLAREDWQPLYPEGPDPGESREQQYQMVTAVLRSLHRFINPLSQDPGAKAADCFADIPMPPAMFAAHIHAAARVAMACGHREPLRFLDVGCGAGLMVLLAAEIFAQADGLEYDPGYVGAAEALFAAVGATRSTVISGDALKYDGYQDYDVIYFYRPINDDTKLRQLQDRIIDQARPGTVLVAPYTVRQSRIDRPDCALIDGVIHVTGADEVSAREIRTEAEFIGTSLMRLSTPPEARSGYMLPLVNAIRSKFFSGA